MNEQLRTLLNVDNEHLVQSVMTLHENFDQLKEEHKILIQSKSIARFFPWISTVTKLDIVSLEEDHFHKSIDQLLEKLDPSSG